MIAFTIVARNYLSLAYTLTASFKRHHPEGKITIVVADGVEGITPPPDHHLNPASSYLGEDFLDSAFKYNVTEFCTAVKPYVFQALLREHPGQNIVYLDPDTYVTARLDCVTEALQTKDIVLTPHLLDCRIASDHTYPEYKHLWEGVFNLGFIALKDGPVAQRLVQWWIVRLRQWCYADRWDGLHTDQKWMDYVPAYFPEALHVSKYRGLNVAHWNLDERKLHTAAGGYMVDGSPLVLFHFSGCDFKNRRLTKHVEAGLQENYRSETLAELLEHYIDEVMANGHEMHIRIPYLFGSFSDGTPVTSLHRRLYRALDDSRKHERPFHSDGYIYRHLAAARLLDRSESARANYTANTVQLLDRKRRIAEFMLKFTGRFLGPRRYSYMIKFFGIYARPEAHTFLIEADSRQERQGRT